MRRPEKITLTKEKKEAMLAAIKTYYFNEREEQIGDLAAALLLNFIMEELAPEIYNQGVYDAYKYINDKSEDLLALLI
mgnify:CR=1 FL=1|jgi:uncharacterized protein (DUF2164 family)